MLIEPNQKTAETRQDTTGYLSRSNCVAQAAQQAKDTASPHPLTIIWIGLDRLKQINESLGHHGGDLFIEQMSRRLQNKAGKNALWYRMAGDEFACLLADFDLEQTSELARSLLGEIQSPLLLCDLLLHPSASMGIATLETKETGNLCLERADRAMKAAKRAGGGQLILSGAEPLPGRFGIHLARHELELENKLHIALQQGGLSLHYQPIISADNKTVCAEALMRCTSHKISPCEFIPIAEKTGLIKRMGEWSLLEGARFAQRLNVAGLRTTVAINVSRAQFSLPDFPKTLHAALLCANVDPALVELELTESLFMDNSLIVQRNLRASHESGVSFAIDDFGTGYSCLAILKDITASKLKIDRTFVVALPHDRRAFSVVESIARLGRDLGMLVVAEGVENQEQLNALTDAGVNTIQGYIHAHPMPDNALLTWLQHRKNS